MFLATIIQASLITAPVLQKPEPYAPVYAYVRLTPCDKRMLYKTDWWALPNIA